MQFSCLDAVEDTNRNLNVEEPLPEFNPYINLKAYAEKRLSLKEKP